MLMVRQERHCAWDVRQQHGAHSAAVVLPMCALPAQQLLPWSLCSASRARYSAAAGAAAAAAAATTVLRAAIAAGAVAAGAVADAAIAVEKGPGSAALCRHPLEVATPALAVAGFAGLHMALHCSLTLLAGMEKL